MRTTTWFRTRFIAAIGATLIAAGAPLAQETTNAFQPRLAGDWTVVTMAPAGSLGVATAATAGQAIAQAIRSCKTMSRQSIGCGAESRAVRAGWIVAMRCGTRNIIAAEALLSDAERAAADREAEMRRLYAPDLPPCRRVLTVDPQGGVGMGS